MLDRIPSCTHPQKYKITYTIQLKWVREVLWGGFKDNSVRANYVTWLSGCSKCSSLSGSLVGLDV